MEASTRVARPSSRNSASSAACSPPSHRAMALMIRSSAQQIQRFKSEQAEITRMLEELSRDNKAVQALKQRPGIATITATALIAEIVDIRRFAREDSLACYSGLGMTEHSSGQTTRMVALSCSTTG